MKGLPNKYEISLFRKLTDNGNSPLLIFLWECTVLRYVVMLEGNNIIEVEGP